MVSSLLDSAQKTPGDMGQCAAGNLDSYCSQDGFRPFQDGACSGLPHGRATSSDDQFLFTGEPEEEKLDEYLLLRAGHKAVSTIPVSGDGDADSTEAGAAAEVPPSPPLARIRRKDARLASLRVDTADGGDARLSFSNFMTGFFALVWPKMSVAAAAVVDRAFSKALNDAINTMPALNGKVSYDVHFGGIAPKIEAVHGYRQHTGADVGIEICGELLWEASVDMKMRVGPMLIGVDRVCLRGTGCIVAKPLLDREPVIGGVQMFFCDMPVLDLGLTGLGGITAWSLVSTAMRNLLQEAFRRMMVLPHRISVRFASTVVNDMPSFKRPPPRGIFRVRLVEARGLAAKDWAFRGRQTCDPYCALRVGNCHGRARTIRKTTQPIWNTDDDVFDFLVFHERQILEVDLYHKDALNVAAARIGSVPSKYTILQLLRMQEKEGDKAIRLPICSALASSKAQQPVQSTISLKVEYCDLVERPGTSLAVPFAVTVRIYHTSGLLQGDAQDAVVRLRVGMQEEATKRCKGVHPKDVLGFGKRQADVMVKLYREGVRPESISAAYNLPVHVVNEVVQVEQGRFSTYGWDQTLTILVVNPTDAHARLEIRIRGQWHLIGEGSIDLQKFRAEEHGAARQDGPGGGQRWKIHAYKGGDAYVGASITVTGTSLHEHPVCIQGKDSDTFSRQESKCVGSPKDARPQYCVPAVSDAGLGKGEEWGESIVMTLEAELADVWSDHVDS